MYDTLTKRIIKEYKDDKKTQLNHNEIQYVITWKEKYKMKDDIIIEAVRRAVKRNKGSFSYINTILENWYKENVTSGSDIMELDKKYQKKYKNTDVKEKVINNLKVCVKKLNKKAIIPTRGSTGAAGMDLYACIDEDVEIHPHETKIIGTGIAVSIPRGYVGLIFARSGLATKNDIAPANKTGVIDDDYRGELKVSCHSHSNEFNPEKHIIHNGDRIAQLVIMPCMYTEFTEVEYLDQTERGTGGFGSTGKN